MYSSKDHVNILTALLLGHGVRHAVVCPGSRNSPVVHNLAVCPELTCYPVTDERSAGFYALGICQALGEPVVVCVTSGSALLNVAPAVAEACYQHLPLVVVSADRPAQWIDQLDGQTLPQPGALGGLVRKVVNLAEPHDDEERCYCNRLVNEALLAARRGGGGPVHINVPIGEPLFDYTVERLPRERVIHGLPTEPTVVNRDMLARFEHARRPMIVVGQLRRGAFPQSLGGRLHALGYVVLQERLSIAGRTAAGLDETMALIDGDDRYLPDFILYVGDTLVSKQARRFLRRAREAECWTVCPDGEIHDVLMNLTGVIAAEPRDVLQQLGTASMTTFRDLWAPVQLRAARYRAVFEPDYSQMLAVKRLEELTERNAPGSETHYANSMAVRLGCIFSWHYIHCNRGVNGIEGSLSTAAGYSLVTDKHVYCVIGDLSFFYDQNALWNRNLRGNLRILLLNNGCGGIFYQLDGLDRSPACDRYVAASHRTTAEGICRENGIAYYCADNTASLNRLLGVLTAACSDRPILLEVQTDGREDARIYQNYIQNIKIWKETGNP